MIDEVWFNQYVVGYAKQTAHLVICKSINMHTLVKDSTYQAFTMCRQIRFGATFLARQAVVQLYTTLNGMY